MTETHQMKEDTPVELGGLVIFLLLWLILIGVFFLVQVTLLIRDLLSETRLDTYTLQLTGFLLAELLNILQIAGALALFRRKRWGYIVLVVVCLINVGLGFYFGVLSGSLHYLLIGAALVWEIRDKYADLG